ncbi:hypothetical protein WICPIJ_001790 [Wickerhamomyces pijperi]|uniref:Uncharacterized protein n=1 Tax=Wickerhamomyces pijperi TaxID=599730 RepID=A0A9P8QAA9_WICPI|nr:hypothetical protein WICPIJ_001790 [Wickerhamomyces pijperi]
MRVYLAAAMVFTYYSVTLKNTSKPDHFTKRDFDSNLSFNSESDSTDQEEIRSLDRTLKYIQLLKEAIPNLKESSSESEFDTWMGNVAYILKALGFSGSNPFTKGEPTELESFIVNSTLHQVLKEDKDSLQLIFSTASSKSNLTRLCQHHKLAVGTVDTLLEGLRSIDIEDIEGYCSASQAYEIVEDYFKTFNGEYGRLKNRSNSDNSFQMRNVRQEDISFIALKELSQCECLMEKINNNINCAFYVNDEDEWVQNIIEYLLTEWQEEQDHSDWVVAPFWT